MPGKVAVVDTSVMCCWLAIPGFDTAGSAPDFWDHQRAKREIDKAIEEGCLLVFPITTLIETGNHISHANSRRFERATAFVEVIMKASDGEAPWVPFAEQFGTISTKALGKLTEDWPDAAVRRVSLGDFLITSVADYYSLSGFSVLIISSDALLRSHVPATPEHVPRRRASF